MASGIIGVAIIGAGPYGLSLAACLKDKGVPFRIFGQPMQFWRDMPRGMFLKSFAFATNIYTRDRRLGFVEYSRERGLETFEPCAIADFAHYGVWVQQRLLPEIEPVEVSRLSRSGDVFELELADARKVLAKRVVVAAGVAHFAHMPAVLAALPRHLASHTSQHRDYGAFAGKDVAIVGAGQSALEAARLLLEAGARPQLLARGPRVAFSSRMPPRRSWWQSVRRPQSALGPGLKNWLLERFPLALHFAPDRWRLTFVASHLGPEGAWWLRDGIIGRVPILTSTTVAAACPIGERVELRLAGGDGKERSIVCDHVIAGTGFKVDLDRLPFLAAELHRSIRRLERGPALDRRFQSSVPGLHFVGFASSPSFGPLFRFVAGAAFTSRTLARALAKSRTARSPQALPLPAESAGALR
jgi:pyridine nucleotide-disulfide oxidoreductase